jgi:hypothetical protein
MASRKGFFDEEKEKARGVATTSAAATGKTSSTVIIDNGKREERDRDRERERERDRERERERERRSERDSRSDPFTIPGYKPSFKLEYKDDRGRDLDEKEAFQQMSHVFHGKGSGKMKTEKRLKKIEEEEQMKKMSTDSSLGFLKNIERQQTALGRAHIVLSGSQQTLLAKPTAKK